MGSVAIIILYICIIIHIIPAINKGISFSITIGIDISLPQMVFQVAVLIIDT